MRSSELIRARVAALVAAFALVAVGCAGPVRLAAHRITTAVPTPQPVAAAVPERIPEPAHHPAPVPAVSVLGARDSAPVQIASVQREGPEEIAVIEIPAIGLKTPVFEGTEPGVLKYGPGHHEQTARPGRVGNAVIPGHRTTHTRPFYEIEQLDPGDVVIFRTTEGTFVYRVYEEFVVRPNDVWIAEQPNDHIVTLYACHPPKSDRYRYVVRARLSPGPAEPAAAPAKPTPTPQPSPRPNWLPFPP